MRIAFTGAQGTGKSTLANHPFFRSTFPDHQIIDGIARKYHSGTWSCRQRQLRVNSQYILEHFRNQKFISARSIYDPWVYTRLTVNRDYFFQIFHQAQKFIKYDILFYVPIEFKIEDDGFRPIDPEYQNNFDYELRNLLHFYSVPFYMLTGSIEQRINKAQEICQKIKA